MSAGIKSFVTEKQLDEKRKERQEEWERVRKPEDPEEAPEEEYDPRSLFERLQEQKDKKQEEFEEKLKFKNQFRGIDEDESAFLLDVNKRNFELEKEKREQEARELNEFRNAVAQSRELPEVPLENISSVETTPRSKKAIVSKKNPQQNILKVAVKRKTTNTEMNSEECQTSSSKIGKTDNDKTGNATIIYPSATKYAGILPGLAAYDDSGDTDDSSSDESMLMSNNLLSEVADKSRYSLE